MTGFDSASFGYFNVEPVGSRAPSFSTESKIFTMDRDIGVNFALLCPAQGFPRPNFK